MTEPLLRMTLIGKRFPGVQALDDAGLPVQTIESGFDLGAPPGFEADAMYRVERGAVLVDYEAEMAAYAEAVLDRLHADGRLDPAQPAANAPALEYDFDPADPVPTIGGSLTSGQPVFEGGAFDQREDARFFGARSCPQTKVGSR